MGTPGRGGCALGGKAVPASQGSARSSAAIATWPQRGWAGSGLLPAPLSELNKGPGLICSSGSPGNAENVCFRLVATDPGPRRLWVTQGHANPAAHSFGDLGRNDCRGPLAGATSGGLPGQATSQPLALGFSHARGEDSENPSGAAGPMGGDVVTALSHGAGHQRSRDVSPLGFIAAAATPDMMGVCFSLTSACGSLEPAQWLCCGRGCLRGAESPTPTQPWHHPGSSG